MSRRFSIELEAAARALGLPPEELAARPLARGVTHETVVVVRRGEPVAVLRLAPPVPGLLPGLSTHEEGRLLTALAGSPVPVPGVLLDDSDGSVLGRPGLIVSHAGGRSARVWEELGEEAAAHALEILAALHRLDPGTALPRGGADDAALDLERWRAVAGEAAPSALAETLDALASRLPPPHPPGLVHGDFQPGNLVVVPGRVAAVIDWELARIGDPVCDLGLATLAAWGTWWPDAELLERYEAAGGTRVEPEALRWWRCLGYAKVIAFLSRRAALGWKGGPAPERFLSGLEDARRGWEVGGTGREAGR